MTQAALANALGVKQAAVAQWECYKKGPKRSRLVEIAGVLDCSVEELLKEDE